MTTATELGKIADKSTLVRKRKSKEKVSEPDKK